MSEDKAKAKTKFTIEDFERLIKIAQNLKFYSSPYLPCNHFEIVEGRTFDDYERDWIIKYHYKRKNCIREEVP